MFNNVILDVATGLTFIFLLYCLLFNSIQEAIATIPSLRVRNLRRVIINRMHCNTPAYSGWHSFLLPKLAPFSKLLSIFRRKPDLKADCAKLGNLFYDHPLIKNYGASRMFPFRSYLPSESFSAVTADLLKQQFEEKRAAGLIKADLGTPPGNGSNPSTESGPVLTDRGKIAGLLAYYRNFYNPDNVPPDQVIQNDTRQTLPLLLHAGRNDMDTFAHKLASWFNDTMGRVSGWCKRQIRFMLFVIALLIAATFNVSAIQIVGCPSIDKNARDQLIQLAVKDADAYKNTTEATGTAGVLPADTATLHIYQQKMDRIKGGLVNDNLPALGRGSYDENKGFGARQNYVLRVAFSDESRMPGFLIFSFGVCLGVPFSFHLRSKLINLRGAGKQAADTGSANWNAPVPVNVSFNGFPPQNSHHIKQISI